MKDFPLNLTFKRNIFDLKSWKEEKYEIYMIICYLKKELLKEEI